ncbi:hypothetical protein BKA81DRAFT_404030 [Phyllosticta paracitricarpa]|uniref:Uncharacterized protein n=2 Tax=Phyllosticta TaxID=121621 RepID=A0ABR1MJU0_9PEZI
MPYADLSRDLERERRPYLRRGSRLSSPRGQRPSFGLSPSRGLGHRSPSYRGADLSPNEDDRIPIGLDQMRRGRSMRRRRSLGMRERSRIGYLDDDEIALGFGGPRAEGLHLPRMQRRYAMPAARERERELDLGGGGRLRALTKFLNIQNRTIHHHKPSLLVSVGQTNVPGPSGPQLVLLPDKTFDHLDLLPERCLEFIKGFAALNPLRKPSSPPKSFVRNLGKELFEKGRHRYGKGSDWPTPYNLHLHLRAADNHAMMSIMKHGFV